MAWLSSADEKKGAMIDSQALACWFRSFTQGQWLLTTIYDDATAKVAPSIKLLSRKGTSGEHMPVAPNCRGIWNISGWRCNGGGSSSLEMAEGP